jgi:hypothetical protein
MFRFSIRDLLWLTVVAALATCWYRDRLDMKRFTAAMAADRAAETADVKKLVQGFTQPSMMTSELLDENRELRKSLQESRKSLQERLDEDREIALKRLNEEVREKVAELNKKREEENEIRLEQLQSEKAGPGIYYLETEGLPRPR